MARDQYMTRERMMMAIESAFPQPSVSVEIRECEAGCRSLEGGEKKECERECQAVRAAGFIAGRLRRELLLSFRDLIWGGGDIDPLPDAFAFERAVRDRFAKRVAEPSPKSKPTG